MAWPRCIKQEVCVNLDVTSSLHGYHGSIGLHGVWQVVVLGQAGNRGWADGQGEGFSLEGVQLAADHAQGVLE